MYHFGTTAISFPFKLNQFWFLRLEFTKCTMSLANSIAATVPKTKHFGKNERKKKYDSFFFFFFFFKRFQWYKRFAEKILMMPQCKITEFYSHDDIWKNFVKSMLLLQYIILEIDLTKYFRSESNFLLFFHTVNADHAIT